jgi:hypothetical protein
MMTDMLLSLQDRQSRLAAQDNQDIAQAEAGQITRQEAFNRCQRRARQRERVATKTFFVVASRESADETR